MDLCLFADIRLISAALSETCGLQVFHSPAAINTPSNDVGLWREYCFLLTVMLNETSEGETLIDIFILLNMKCINLNTETDL